MASIVEEQEALQNVVVALVACRPPHAVAMEVRAAILHPTSTYAVFAVNGDGEKEMLRGRGKISVLHALEALREAMYEPGVGTWFSMTGVLDRSGRLETTFDDDGEGDFGLGGVASTAYAEDQQRFPRDEAHQPEWLKARLAQARKIGTE